MLEERCSAASLNLKSRRLQAQPAHFVTSGTFMAPESNGPPRSRKGNRELALHQHAAHGPGMRPRAGSAALTRFAVSPLMVPGGVYGACGEPGRAHPPPQWASIARRSRESIHPIANLDDPRSKPTRAHVSLGQHEVDRLIAQISDARMPVRTSNRNTTAKSSASGGNSGRPGEYRHTPATSPHLRAISERTSSEMPVPST